MESTLHQTHNIPFFTYIPSKKQKWEIDHLWNIFFFNFCFLIKYLEDPNIKKEEKEKQKIEYREIIENLEKSKRDKKMTQRYHKVKELLTTEEHFMSNFLFF